MSENGGQERRTFLKLVSGSMVAAGMGSGGAVASEAVPAIDQSESVLEKTTVSVRNRESGEVSVYRSLSDIDPTTLAAGEYEVIERTVTPTAERIERQGLRSNGALSTAADDEFDPVVQIGDETNEHNFDPYFSTGDTVPIWVGAVQEDGGVPVGVSGVALEVEILDPDGEVLETYEETTNDEGYALIEHEIEAGATDGIYEAELSHSDAFSRAQFGVGETVEIIDRDGSLTPGQETTVAVYAVDGGEPIATSVDVTIEGPNETDDRTVETDANGIGLFSFTPQGRGTYRIDVGSDLVSLESRERAAYSQTAWFTDQRVGEPVLVDGHVFEGTEPASNLEIELTLEERNVDEPVDVVTTTTDQHGQFVAEFDEAEEVTDYDVGIETSDGQEVASDIRVWIDDFEEDTDDIEIDVSFDSDGFQLVPGETVTATADVTEGGAPRADESVTLTFEIGFRGVPYETVSLETDADGKATTTVTVPEELDNVRFYAEASVTVDDETVTDSTSQNVQRYDEQIRADSLAPGEPVTVTAETTDVGSDEAYADVDVTVFGARDHTSFETFDADAISTGADGTGETELDVPENTRRGIGITDITEYRSSSNWFSPQFNELSLEYDGPEEVTPGGQASITYSVGTTESNTAVITLFDVRSGYLDAMALEEGATASFDIPSYLEDGETVEVHINVVTESGAVEEYTEFLSVDGDVDVAEPPTAALEVSPAEPTVGESVDFDASDSEAGDVPIDSYEWAIDGESLDASGSIVTDEFDDPGEYTVEVTVVDADGEDDTVSETVTVVDDEPPEGVSEYENDDGEVDTEGLRDAIDDWRNDDEVDTDLLREVIDAWRSS